MDGSINIEYYPEDNLYCAAWEPMAALGAGETEQAALEDLRGVVRYAIDCCINTRLEKSSTCGEPGGKQGGS